MQAELRHVPVKMLLIDHACQRSTANEWMVRKLRRGWDEDAVGVLIGSLRADGMVYLIDGMSRYTAKFAESDYEFLVLCLEGLTPERESQLFVAFNRDRAVVSQRDIFRVSVNAGHPLEVAMQAALDQRGLLLGGRASGGRIAAVASCTGVARTYGLAVFAETLDVIRTAWEPTGDSWNGAIIGAVAIMLDRGAEPERLIAALARKTPAAWVSESSQRGNQTGSMDLARVMAPEYNKRLRTNRVELPAKVGRGR